MCEPLISPESPPTATARFAAYLLSCPGREELRERTLASLRRTDWNDEPCVILDCSDHPDRRVRQVETCRRLLETALESAGWDYLLFLEDDVELNIHLRHNLESWWPIRHGQVRLASLYNPGVRLLVHGPDCAAADPDTVYGSQAMLLARCCAAYVLNNYNQVIGMQDIRFGRLSQRLGPIYYHTPSLVQHVGRVSVWGGSFHEAADFDPRFRA
jgi:hypothetical protein